MWREHGMVVVFGVRWDGETEVVRRERSLEALELRGRRSGVLLNLAESVGPRGGER